jgi:glycosyltransferase involved in cell wall biosynthesis/acetyltransferase-like isoleucine patch superfamily enzyme
MIVKNEESCLEACLNSVKGADEIVIVDTGSTDKTIEIAKKYTDKVFSGPEYLWRDDFAFSRNQCLEKCTGDWVLIIDADETLEPDGMEKIRAIVASTAKDAVFFHAVSSDVSRELHRSIRLIKRDKALWKGRIHNYLTVSSGEDSDIRIVYGHSDAHKNDPDRAIRILTKVLAENPKAARERYFLAREYWVRRDYVKAVEHYSAYLQVSTYIPEMADAWLMLSRCFWVLGEQEDAKSACLQAINVNPNFSEAINFMADMSGPVKGARWRSWAETATDEGVLIVRKNTKLSDILVKAEPEEEETDEQIAGVYRPHPEHSEGTFSAGEGCCFSPGSHIDCTGDVSFGDHCYVGRNLQIYTHDHKFHKVLVPDVTKEHGITASSLAVGTNVVFADDVTVLAGVGSIGDNALIGTKSVLTHRVGEGEIWAGNPARCVGTREVEVI